jgi:hypothetical protein
VERFSVASTCSGPGAEVPVTEEVTIELKRQKVTAVARQHHSADRSPGSRRRRRAKSVRAERVWHRWSRAARMLNNDALDDDEVVDGWVVSCQAMPTSTTIKVVYE